MSKEGVLRGPTPPIYVPTTQDDRTYQAQGTCFELAEDLGHLSLEAVRRGGLPSGCSP